MQNILKHVKIHSFSLSLREMQVKTTTKLLFFIYEVHKNSKACCHTLLAKLCGERPSHTLLVRGPSGKIPLLVFEDMTTDIKHHINKLIHWVIICVTKYWKQPNIMYFYGSINKCVWNLYKPLWNGFWDILDEKHKVQITLHTLLFHKKEKQSRRQRMHLLFLWKED